MTHPQVKAACSFLDSIPGFSYEVPSDTAIKIYSVYLSSSLMFYPTTGSFVFASETDSIRFITPSKKLPLATLIKMIKESGDVSYE